MMRTGGISPQAAGTATSNATTTSMVKEAGNTFSAGDNRICSDRESEKNECSNNALSTEGRGCSKKPLCYGHRQRKKLLHMQQIQAHGPTLQKQGAKN